MLEPTTAVSTIYAGIRLVCERVQLVKANGEQCRRLAERVKFIEEKLDVLENRSKTDQCQDALERFKAWLDDCLAFIEKFTEEKWIQKVVISTNANKAQFDDLNKRLEQVMGDLNLGLNVQEIMDRKKDVEDRKKDHRHLIHAIHEIKKWQKENAKALQAQVDQLSIDQAARHDLMQAVIESVQSSIAALQKPLEEKPLIESRFKVNLCELMPNICQVLKQGVYSTVYLGELHGQQVAIKLWQAAMGEREKQKFVREVQIMSRLRTPHIVLFQAACLNERVSEERVAIVMEYMDQGSLCDVLAKEGAELKELKRAKIALDIARGLLYLHAQKMIHRNLTSEHILLSGNRAKIGGLGSAKVMSGSVATMTHTAEPYPWMSPELFDEHPIYSYQSDIYAYGVILWELITGKRPYAECIKDVEIIQRKRKGEGKLETSSNVPQCYVDIIERCMAQHPKDRPELREIIGILEKRVIELEAFKINHKGEEYEKKGEWTKAEAKYHEAAEKGCGKAYVNLGFWRLKGLGGKTVDKKECYSLFFKGAELGNSQAQFNVGQMLEYGDKDGGVPENLSDALDWYRKAANQGHEKAQQRIKRVNEKLRELDHNRESYQAVYS